MKIAVLGLTGHVGKLFAERALAAGHELSAVVRNPAKLAEFAPGVRAVKGDLLSSDLAPLVEAFQGVDVVVAMIGMTSGNDSPNIMETGVTHALAAMATAGVKRFIFLGSCFVSQPEDKWSILDSVLYFAVTSTFLKRPYLDCNKAYKVVLGAPSTVDWVFVRFALLGDGPAVGKTRIGQGVYNGAGAAASTISRADVAEALLQFCTNQELAATWNHKAPLVTV